MKFTRRQVLEAIRYENLSPGYFCETASTDENGRCKVCAVGGLLRRAGVPVTSIGQRAWHLIGGYGQEVALGGDEEEALENGNYLLALSVKFEKTAATLGTGKRTRKILANFVKKNFPKEFQSVRK